jgi:hypothetical protein
MKDEIVTPKAVLPRRTGARHRWKVTARFTVLGTGGKRLKCVRVSCLGSGLSALYLSERRFAELFEPEVKSAPCAKLGGET